ncbi:MarR family winged helix-turn-helix transcriptional regulator [Brevibacterium album]|uniref:MarR family winged helix-turn-helix transcriptional regulator n=1 Tax=Brevibacterium album TaxID=417948 RepID=UPI00040E2DEC|nr:MarR family transcriptional regulator [Brevibacterium album]
MTAGPSEASEEVPAGAASAGEAPFGTMSAGETQVGPPSGAVSLLSGGELLGEPAVMRAWRTYFETSQRLIAHLGERMKQDSDMELGDFNVLMVLAEAPERTLAMTALAERLVFSVPRLSYRAKALAERGWVRKERAAHDGRVQHVILTDAGARQLIRVGQAHRERVREVFDSVLAPEEIEALGGLSARVGGALG